MTDRTNSRRKPALKPAHAVFLVAFLVSAIGLRLWQLRWPEVEVRLSGENLRVLVANTPAHKYRGLGKRESLPPYDGMLFSYQSPARHGIVMRAMKFPIDIVWFNNGVVIDIAPNVPLEPGKSENEFTVYRPRQEANAVLELSAGRVEQMGLKIGDRMQPY